jgi:Replication-relaxation
MSEYLSSFRHKENVYYLNKQGREVVRATKICKKTPQIDHYLMRNSLYIHLGCPVKWQNEIKMKVGGVHIVADALFENKTSINIVEVDFTQKMIENRKKIEKYQEIVNMTGRNFKFHWITTTHNRQKQLYELHEGLNISVLLAQDFI